MSMSVGTLRGLQQMSTDEGIFTITAMDQRGALKSMLNPGGDVPYATMREVKVDVVSALSPHSTAMLLDPEYGAAECIAERSLAGHSGLIVSIEETGYTADGSGRLASLIPNWGVSRIKRMGAQAVKLLVYYHPDEVEAARKQRELIKRVLEDCRKFDIPLLVEAVGYPLAGQDKAAYAATKPDVVVRSAKELTELGFDVYKAEFPVDLSYPHDESKLGDWCRQLDQASPIPWIILSAGVDIDQFVRQVEVACQNGASGFLAGRAIWKESVRLKDREERRAHLRTKAVENLQRCSELAIKYARPFYEKLGRPQGFGDIVQEGWHKQYPGL
jgi:tagatose 1,6-diphosphate aldolase